MDIGQSGRLRIMNIYSKLVATFIYNWVSNAMISLFRNDYVCQNGKQRKKKGWLGGGVTGY